MLELRNFNFMLKMSQKWKMEFRIGSKLESAIKCSCWIIQEIPILLKMSQKWKMEFGIGRKIGISNKMLILKQPRNSNFMLKISQKLKMEFGIGRKLESAIKCSCWSNQEISILCSKSAKNAKCNLELEENWSQQ